MPKLLHLMVACAENRVMGRKDRLPWRIPEDLQQFHDHVAHQTIVLGRICYQTWPRARQDGHRLIVVTSDDSLAADGVRIAHTVKEALAIGETLPGDIYINGGERIFEEVLSLERPMILHLTLIHATLDGDRYFPEWRNLRWREIDHRDGADENYRYTFYTLERVLDGDPKKGA